MVDEMIHVGACDEISGNGRLVGPSSVSIGGPGLEIPGVAWFSSEIGHQHETSTVHFPPQMLPAPMSSSRSLFFAWHNYLFTPTFSVH